MRLRLQRPPAYAFSPEAARRFAMLLEDEAEAFLAREGVAYLAVGFAGVPHGPAVAP